MSIAKADLAAYYAEMKKTRNAALAAQRAAALAETKGIRSRPVTQSTYIQVSDLPPPPEHTTPRGGRRHRRKSKKTSRSRRSRRKATRRTH